MSGAVLFDGEHCPIALSCILQPDEGLPAFAPNLYGIAIPGHIGRVLNSHTGEATLVVDITADASSPGRSSVISARPLESHP